MLRTVTAIFILHFGICALAQTAPAFQSVVLSKGKVKFPLKHGDAELRAQYCPRNFCVCNSDIQYVRLTGTENQTALNLINRKLRSEAGQVSCKYFDAYDALNQRITYLSDRLVSVVEEMYSQEWGTGGSCHGSSLTHTFNLTTGKEYHLSDIISNVSLDRLRASLPASVVAEKHRRDARRFYESEKSSWPDDPSLKHFDFNPPPRSSDIYQAELNQADSAIAFLDDKELLRQGFFLQKGHVLIDVGGYVFSCADGSFNPGEIPARLITLPLVRQEFASAQMRRR